MSVDPNVSGPSRNPARRLRVFLSYAHGDANVLYRVVRALEAAGMVPVWDAEIQPGRTFTTDIQRRIATAHVFMPVLTPNSVGRPWIHQEIGFALGIDVPVVPLAIGELPGEMIEGLQAVVVKDDLTDLDSALERFKCDELVPNGQRGSILQALGVAVQIADFTEERTRTLVAFARETAKPSPIRQRAIFSSFSLPDADPSDPLWDAIELRRHRSDYYRQLLREERRILEEHARGGGCYLILRPFLDYRAVGPGVHRQQLQVLAGFLRAMPSSLVTVAIADTGEHGNLTLVGDWFGARALPPRPGSEYRDTLFSHHGPTVLRWVEQFDEEVSSILRRNKVGALESRDYALHRIQARLKQLPSDWRARHAAGSA